MDASLKTIFSVCFFCLLILLATGIFLPVVTSLKLPVWLSLVIVIAMFGISFLCLINILKMCLAGKCILDSLNKITEDPEDLFNYSVEKKE